MLNISLNIGNFGPRRVDGFEKVLRIRPEYDHTVLVGPLWAILGHYGPF